MYGSIAPPSAKCSPGLPFRAAEERDHQQHGEGGLDVDHGLNLSAQPRCGQTDPDDGGGLSTVAIVGPRAGATPVLMRDYTSQGRIRGYGPGWTRTSDLRIMSPPPASRLFLVPSRFAC